MHRVWDAARLTPVGTRVLMCAVVLGTMYALWDARRGGGDGSVRLAWDVVFVPRISWRRPWTVLTSSLCVASVFELFLHMLCIPLVLSQLEHQWGMLELWLFCAVVSTGTNLVLFVVVGIIAGVQSLFVNTPPVLSVPFYGMYTIFVGGLMAYVQLMPDKTLIWPASTHRFRDLLMFVVGVSNIPIIFGVFQPFLPVQIAWIIAWIYLRFYQRHASGVYGDRNAMFALPTFFPPLVHPVLRPLLRGVYQLTTALHLLPAHDDEDDVELAMPADLPPPTSNARAEAERRRIMALHALDSQDLPSESEGARDAAARAKTQEAAATAFAASTKAGDSSEPRAAPTA